MLTAIGLGGRPSADRDPPPSSHMSARCCRRRPPPASRDGFRWRKTQVLLLAGFGALVLVDCGSCILLCAGTGHLVDLLIATVCRSTLLVVVSYLGFRAWRLSQQGSIGELSMSGGISMHELGANLLRETRANGPDSASSSLSSLGMDPLELTTDALSDEQQRAESRQRGEQKRDAAVWVNFAICSLGALYSGLKCVQFHGSDAGDAFQGGKSVVTVVIGLGVFMCHGEFYLGKKVLTELTATEGVLLPWLHPHPLHFVIRAEQRTCQTCRARIRYNNHNAMAFYCPLCVFHYYCIECLKRQLRQRRDRAPTAVNGAAASNGGGGGGAPAASTLLEGQVHSGILHYLRRVAPLLQPLWCAIALALTVLAVNQAFVIAAPQWQGSVLDSVAEKDMDKFKRNVVAYLLVNLGNGLFSSFQSSMVLLIIRKLNFRTRQMVFRQILRQDIAYFDAHLTGQITSRLTQDVQQMSSPVELMMNNLIANLIRIIGGIFMCFHTSWKLSLLAMAAIFPITYLVRTYSEWAGKIQRKIQDEYGEANAAATQAISNIRTVRCFGAEPFEWTRYEASLLKVYNFELKDNLTRIGNQTFTSYLDLGLGVFVLWYGGAVIIAGDDANFSLGQLITFQLYWNMMKNAFNGLNQVLSALLRATSASQRVLDLLDLRPLIETEEGEELRAASDVSGEIAFEGVSFHYVQKRSERPVLSSVSLAIPAGQVTALVGKSGSGKSTMASLLLRLYDPIAGRLTLDGRDYRSIQPRSLRSHFGVVAQDTQLFAGNIEDNVAYNVMRAYEYKELEDAARSANAFEFIEKCEDGFKTLVGDRGTMLSGGQKQRISIARVFLRKPRILLLDEATSALDAENESVVQAALDGLVESGVCRTVVVIAHRLSTVRNAHQIVVMQDGEVAERGTHEELLALGLETGIYAQLVQKQLHGFDGGKPAVNGDK